MRGQGLKGPTPDVLVENFLSSKRLQLLVVGSILALVAPPWALLTPRAPRWAPILRPTNPAGSEVLAQHYSSTRNSV